MKSLYTYMGSKSRHLNIINSLVSDSKSTNYCEPFLGSAVVFLNLEKQFNIYWLNDTQEENMLAFKFCSELTEEFVTSTFYDSIMKYPMNNKEAFYLFRELMLNATSYNDPKKAVYIFRIYNSCINGMIRFNKSKFNSAYGSKNSSCNFSVKLKSYLDSINLIREKNISSSSISFENLLDKKDCLYFFDPPYITNEMGCTGGFNKASLSTLVHFMMNTKEEFIYFDMLNEINKPLLEKYNNCIIDKIRSISPSEKNLLQKKKYLFGILSKSLFLIFNY